MTMYMSINTQMAVYQVILRRMLQVPSEVYHGKCKSDGQLNVSFGFYINLVTCY